MTLQAIRDEFLRASGRYDLGTIGGADGGANRFLNAAQRWLDRRQLHPMSKRRFQADIGVGEYLWPPRKTAVSLADVSFGASELFPATTQDIVLGDDLTLNGDFGIPSYAALDDFVEDFGEEFVNKLVNGTFDDDTNWTLQDTWSIAGGKLVMTCVGEEETPFLALETVPCLAYQPGKSYNIEYTISGLSGNALCTPVFYKGGSTQYGIERSANGTYNEDIIAPDFGEGLLFGFEGGISGGGAGGLSIDDASIIDSTVPGWDLWHDADEEPFALGTGSVNAVTGPRVATLLSDYDSFLPNKFYRIAIPSTLYYGKYKIVLGSSESGWITDTGETSVVLKCLSADDRLSIVVDTSSSVVVWADVVVSLVTAAGWAFSDTASRWSYDAANGWAAFVGSGVSGAILASKLHDDCSADELELLGETPPTYKVGAFYKVSYDCTIAAGLGLRARMGSSGAGLGVVRTTSGSYSDYLVYSKITAADHGVQFAISKVNETGGALATITNVTVQLVSADGWVFPDNSGWAHDITNPDAPRLLYDGTGGASMLDQYMLLFPTLNLTSGSYYLLTYTAALSSGLSIVPTFGPASGYSLGIKRSASGTYTELIRCSPVAPAGAIAVPDSAFETGEPWNWLEGVVENDGIYWEWNSGAEKAGTVILGSGGGHGYFCSGAVATVAGGKYSIGYTHSYGGVGGPGTCGRVRVGLGSMNEEETGPASDVVWGGWSDRSEDVISSLDAPVDDARIWFDAEYIDDIGSSVDDIAFTEIYRPTSGLAFWAVSEDTEDSRTAEISDLSIVALASALWDHAGSLPYGWRLDLDSTLMEYTPDADNAKPYVCWLRAASFDIAWGHRYFIKYDVEIDDSLGNLGVYVAIGDSDAAKGPTHYETGTYRDIVTAEAGSLGYEQRLSFTAVHNTAEDEIPAGVLRVGNISIWKIYPDCNALNDLRSIHAMWCSDGTDRHRMYERDIHTLKFVLGRSDCVVNPGTPRYWARNIETLGGAQQNIDGEESGFSTHETDDIIFQNGKQERQIWMIPPADKTYTVVLEGLFYTAPLVNDEDQTYWTEEAPQALLFASLWMLENYYRNSEGAKDWMNALNMELAGIDMDLADQESTGRNQMEG